MNFKAGDRVMLDNNQYKGFFGVVKSVVSGVLYKVDFDKLNITLTCSDDNLKPIN